MAAKNQALNEVCTLCRFLAETEESYTESTPGLATSAYRDSWTVCGDDGIAFPLELLDQPFATPKRFGNAECIFGVDQLVLLDWLVAHGTISPEMKELALAKLTLHLMGD